MDGINRIFRENLTGIRVIRSFNNDSYETKRFDGENKNFMHQSKKLFKLMSATEPIFFLLMNIAALAIYVVASLMINDGVLQVGKLIAFMEYLFHAMFSVMLFCIVFMMYPRANISAKRILKVLETDTSITNAPKDTKTEDKHSIIFDKVTFAYPDGEEAVLKDISFEAREGETVAFIGSTGSGKSTLIHLIPRFYDVSSGRILIDGKDVRDWDTSVLRNKIGFVAQKANLFLAQSKKIFALEKKMRRWRKSSMRQRLHRPMISLWQSLTSFRKRLLKAQPMFPGGQKQRLSIARALVRKPQIYIYDDSFSALDFKTDAALRHALKDEVKNSIVLIVAQRVSTIMDADRIIVLDEGRVAGIGTHQELLNTCRIYHEIAASQLSEEELNNG